MTPLLPRVFDTLGDAFRELPKDARTVGTVAASHFAMSCAGMMRLASVLGYELAVVPCNHGRQLTVFAIPRSTPNAATSAEEVRA